MVVLAQIQVPVLVLRSGQGPPVKHVSEQAASRNTCMLVPCKYRSVHVHIYVRIIMNMWFAFIRNMLCNCIEGCM